MYSRWGGVFDIESKRKTVEEAAEKEQQPGFWDDPKEAEKFLKTVSPVKSWVSSYDELISMIGDIEVLSEFVKSRLPSSGNPATNSKTSWKPLK